MAEVAAAQAPPLPDALDILVGPPGGKSNVMLLLDGSASMNGGPVATGCTWYANTYNGGDTTLKQIDQLKATLIGCREPGDGVIDTHSGSVNLAVRVMQNPLAPIGAPETPWGLDPPAAKASVAVINVGGGGNTPMVASMRRGRRDFDDRWNDGNARPCAKNFFVIVADGNSNGSSELFNEECDNAVPPISFSASSPDAAAEYLATSGDFICSLSGPQPINSYAIGINPQGGAAAQLQSIADLGGGEYFSVSNQQELAAAFEVILRNIATRDAVYYSAPTVSQDNLFAGKYSYISSFKPGDRGPWAGNIKKVCTFPTRFANGNYDTASTSCLFKSPDGRALYTNPAAVDVWTGDATRETDRGGIGEMLATGGGSPNLGPVGGAPQTPLRPRSVVTWRPGTSGYVAVQPGSWGRDDAWTIPSQHSKLLNVIHGYTYDADDDGDPTEVARWPVRDPIHSSTAVLRYGPDCDVAGACYVVFGTNDGALRFIESSTGEESTALIPGELWAPNTVSTNALASLQDQPTLDIGHRYYVDGPLRTFHYDADGDGVIDPTESAYLVFTLGRGGRALYQIPISRFTGQLTSTNNPPRVIHRQPGTAFGELQHTLAGPWLGLYQPETTTYSVAAFATGHVPEHDRPTSRLPRLAPQDDTITPRGSPNTDNSPCTWLNPGCDNWDPSGYADPAPLDETFGPFAIPDAIAYRLHFRKFDLDRRDRLEIETGQGHDVAVLTKDGEADSSAPWMNGFTLASNGGWTPWIYSTDFGVRFVTDGRGTNNKGYTIDKVEFLTRSSPGDGRHDPTVFIVDLDRWNGSSPKSFTDSPDAGGVLVRIARRCNGTAGTDTVCVDETVSPDLTHMTCPISGEVSVYTEVDRLRRIYWGDLCGQLWAANAPLDGGAWTVRRLLQLNDADVSDQATPAGASKDFRKLFRKIDMGVIHKPVITRGEGRSPLRNPRTQEWHPVGSWVLGFLRCPSAEERPWPAGESHPIDIVSSSCPGKRVTGLYFGTGNVQRPTARDELQDGALNDGREIIGVVWDDGTVSGMSIDDLADATTIPTVDPVEIATSDPAGRGWYLRLDEDERMLRDPLVMDGVAFFKTHVATPTVQWCTASSGLERVYAMNNCTAEAASDMDLDGDLEPSDRISWTGPGDVGGGFLVLTPPKGHPIVSHGSLDRESHVGGDQSGSLMRIFLWREPKEH